ncbi:sugar kinase [Paenibacillus vini]|uniref:2-dehydro-3-deoxygluconokinase n=1 Tax=Paenibacillus vini TaxID=1476024 RepID=A0ABQ4MC36_9BACL|nr:sugar kinase [Paenibacillus vini]GIP53546.1 2-dehydro-3-deoxygluconokinase [Paenibacillus vini]
MEVVTFGESMVLFSGDQELPLEYVHQFHKQMAGAESNVAIGLARLGHSTGWFSKLGQDAFGRYILQSVRGQGVDTSRCTYTDAAPTAVFFKERGRGGKTKVYYYRQGSAASLMTNDDLDESYLTQAKILHVTGITPALSESCFELTKHAMDVAKRNQVSIVFDPNIRWKLWDRDTAKSRLLELAARADYILPGLDEGEFLTGRPRAKEIAEFFLKLGSKAVVVKLGKDGAYYQSLTERGHVPAIPVQEIDPVGAGDGFAAGFISGLLRNDSLAMSVTRANAVGAIVVGVQGDTEGLPNEEELQAMLSGQTGYQNVQR